MGKELDCYRDVLEDILAASSGRRLLTGKDVAAYLGIDPRTARKRYAIPEGGILAPVLARRLLKA